MQGTESFCEVGPLDFVKFLLWRSAHSPLCSPSSQRRRGSPVVGVVVEAILMDLCDFRLCVVDDLDHLVEVAGRPPEPCR